MNLFETAQEAPKTKSSKKSDKQVVTLKGTAAKDLDELVALKAEMAKLKAKTDMLEKAVKENGQAEFAELYDAQGKYPGSFNIESKTSQVMFVPTDRYLKIDKERASELTERYDKSIVETDVTYSLDTALVNEYGQQLSDAIIGAKNIPDDVKHRLIIQTKSFAVAKGTIENVLSYGRAEDVLADIEPVCQMKNFKNK